MKRINYYFEAKEEYHEQSKIIGAALFVSVTIAVSFILAFILWLELEFGMLSTFWTSFTR